MRRFRVFVGCIPGDTDEGELTALLSKHACIVSVNLATTRNSRDQEFCLGYGFAICARREDMQRLLQLSGQVYYRGRQVTLREYKVGARLKEDKKHFNRRRLFIGNIPGGIRLSEIQVLFEPYGPIENIYTVNQASAQEFKFGYVVFRHEESAQKAMQQAGQYFVEGSKLRVEYFNGGDQQETAGRFNTQPKRARISNTESPDQRVLSQASEHSTAIYVTNPAEAQYCSSPHYKGQSYPSSAYKLADTLLPTASSFRADLNVRSSLLELEPGMGPSSQSLQIKSQKTIVARHSLSDLRNRGSFDSAYNQPTALLDRHQLTHVNLNHDPDNLRLNICQRRPNLQPRSGCPIR